MSRSSNIKPKPKPVTGWLEHVDLPELGLFAQKAKIDTGARTSSLHVDTIAPYTDEHGAERAVITKYVRHKGEARSKLTWDVELHDFRKVKSSNGAVEERAVIATQLTLGGITRKREFTLTNRKKMRYQILVGRKGLGSLFHVNPARKFLLDPPPAGDTDSTESPS